MIQLELNEDEVEMLPVEKVKELYDNQIDRAKELMANKNHDYAEAWREMSQESYVDLILAKLLRIKQIVSNDGVTIASEGVDSNFFDILNYAAFALIMISEGKHL